MRQSCHVGCARWTEAGPSPAAALRSLLDMSAEDPPEQPAKKRRSRFVPKRPPPQRDELLRMLKNHEPLSVGEITDAVRDKRLTEEEAAEVLPSFYGEAARDC